MSPSAETAAHGGPARAAPIGSVAEDLEAIFPTRSDAAAPQRSQRRQGAQVKAPTGVRRADARAATLGALLAAAALGVAAGALITRHPRLAAPAPAAMPKAQAVAPSPRTPPLPPLAEVAALTPAPTVRAPLEVQTPRARAAPLRPATKAAAPHPRATRGGVMAAEARLRRAYLSASRAGAPRATLVAYHDRWVRLQRRAARNPADTAQRYREMAADLDRLAARPHRVSYHARRRDPLAAIGHTLSALWR